MHQLELTTTAPVLDLTPQDLDSILDELGAYHAIFSPLFQRREQQAWSLDYLHGLLLELPRKSIEPIVLHLHGGDRNAVRAMQQFLSEGAWDDTVILQRLWQELATDLGHADGVLILDGSDFPKQGTQSVGVQRQYCGQLGKTANCQAGVFLAYASPHGYALLDRRLYLPEVWLTDAYAERRTACGVPDGITFTTKPSLGWSMIEAVVQAGTLPCRWVSCDEAFGRDTALLDKIAGPAVWLVLRRSLTDGELKTYLCNAPADLPHQRLAGISGMRWPIETCFEVGKQELGMGDYEVRSWRGWHHHLTLVLVALAFLVRLQGRLKKTLRR